MDTLSAFIPILTIVMLIGMPALIFIQLYNKKSSLKKVPSIKIWNYIVRTIGRPPKVKLNLFNISFLVQLILLCLLAYLCSAPFIFQENKSRPVFNILVNRSTSMAAKSEMYSSRWERLKKTLYNQLLENGLKSEDLINLHFNPPLNVIYHEIPLTQIDKIINETALVDMPPVEEPFFQIARSDNQNIYVTDSITEMPISLKNKFSILFIQDKEHINVGWVEFWIEGQTINGVLKNFSDYSLNVNIDLKINGISIQANDFSPAIKPNDSFLFCKTIQEDFNNINLIELFVSCPGDCLDSDNVVYLSRLRSQKLKVMISPDISSAVIKAIRAMSDKVEVTIGNVSSQISSNQFDLIVGRNFNSQFNINQLIINGNEGNSFFQVLDSNVNSHANNTQWLNSNEQQLLANVMFERVFEIKENLLSVKLLIDDKNVRPLILKWNRQNNLICLLNFDCSDKATLTRTPAFPFLISKVIEEMNYNKFHYFKTGNTIEEYNVSTKHTKVFQSSRKGSVTSIDFNNSDSVLLTNAGIFSNENINICVNLLNSKESEIKQTFISNQMHVDFEVKIEKTPFDLKPYIAGLILVLFAFEWVLSKKEL
jgi:hypothetical protein